MIVHQSPKLSLKFKSIIVISIMIFGLGSFWFVKIVYENSSESSFISKVLRKIYLQPKSALKMAFVSWKPPHLSIDIKFKHAQKLAELREKALKRGTFILKSEKSYFPAKLNYKEEQIPVKLRLKGDILGHLIRDRWSLRVRIKSDQRLFGMREFSIQRPDIRDGIYDWYFFKHLRKEKVLTPRVKFVTVSINGKNKGVYFLEEGFSKELLESQKRREGFIVKYDESVLWENRAHLWEDAKNMFNSVFHPVHMNVFPYPDAFNFKKPVRGNRAVSSVYLNAMKVLNHAMVEQKADASDIFDVETMAKFMVLSELWNGKHGLHWNNLRFYFNPISQRLEPIGFDSEAGPGMEFYGFPPFNGGKYVLMGYIFKDLEIFRRFAHFCQNYSQASYLENIKKEFEKEEKLVSLLLKSEHQYKTDIDWNYLLERQKKILVHLNPATHLNVFAVVNKDKLHIDIENLTNLPLSIDEIKFGKTGPKIMGDEIRSFAKDPFYKEEINLVVLARMHSSKFTKLVLPKKYSDLFRNNGQEITLGSRVIGTKSKKQTRSFNYLPRNLAYSQALDQGLPIPPSEERFLESNKFIKRLGKKKYLVHEGEHYIKRYLVTPKESVLIIPAGTKLFFNSTSGLVVNGQLVAEGREDKKVFMGASKDSWRGIFVQNSKQESVLRWVEIKDVTNPNRNGWILTGGVTFYQSNVSIENTQFIGSNAEDLLNLVNSNFRINGSKFEKCDSDAIDSDFSEGNISNTVFSNIKGDAIDFSGSSAKIFDVSIFDIGDKAVSAGEKSTVNVNNAVVQNARMGLVSKDQSKIVAENVVIKRSRIGLAAYQKKAEFGGGSISGKKMSFSKNERDVLIQKGSAGMVNGNRISEEEMDVDKLYERNSPSI